MAIDVDMFNFTQILDSSEINFLISNIKPIHLKKDAILFYQGDLCQEILLLVSGHVTLYIYSDTHDQPITLYTIGEGEQCIINTASAMSNTPLIANAKTTSDIVGYMMPVKITKKLIRMNEAYQDYIFSLFSLKFTSLTHLIEDIKFKKLDARILALLTAKNQHYITITHQQIAEQLNSSREVVSRTLKTLENTHKIKRFRGKIELM